MVVLGDRFQQRIVIPHVFTVAGTGQKPDPLSFGRFKEVFARDGHEVAAIVEGVDRDRITDVLVVNPSGEKVDADLFFFGKGRRRVAVDDEARCDFLKTPSARPVIVTEGREVFVADLGRVA